MIAELVEGYRRSAGGTFHGGEELGDAGTRYRRRVEELGHDRDEKEREEEGEEVGKERRRRRGGRRGESGPLGGSLPCDSCLRCGRERDWTTSVRVRVNDETKTVSVSLYQHDASLPYEWISPLCSLPLCSQLISSDAAQPVPASQR